MSQPPKSNKRIVSKGQYVLTQGKRLGIGSIGIVLLVLSVLCALAAVLFIGVILLVRSQGGSEFAMSGFVISGLLALFFGRLGLANIRQVKTIDPGIPLTRKAAEILPAEESLVRASAEPTQEQQTVLLRASIDNHETPIEHLVRPAGEP